MRLLRRGSATRRKRAGRLPIVRSDKTFFPSAKWTCCHFRSGGYHCAKRFSSASHGLRLQFASARFLRCSGTWGQLRAASRNQAVMIRMAFAPWGARSFASIWPRLAYFRFTPDNRPGDRCCGWSTRAIRPQAAFQIRDRSHDRSEPWAWPTKSSRGMSCPWRWSAPGRSLAALGAGAGCKALLLDLL